MGTKRIVHLRIYKGKELNYDSAGKIKNENQLVKLVYKSREWHNFLKHIIINGICSVVIETVLIEAGKGYREVKATKDELAEVKKASVITAIKAPPSEAEIENIELKKKLEAYENRDMGEHGKEINQTNNPIIKPEDMTFPELRRVFPKIKAKNHKKFLEEIEKLNS